MDRKRFKQLLSVEECVAHLLKRKIIAYPTEAVYGLGCDPDDEEVVRNLLALKGRPVEKGLILVAANYQQLRPYVDEKKLQDVHREKMFASWPGPITWVLPAQVETPSWLTGNFSSLAVRVSAHPTVQALCRAFGKPVVSTSANLSMEAPCCTNEEVFQQFGHDFLVLSGKIGGSAYPSEIRDLMSGLVIRQGNSKIADL